MKRSVVIAFICIGIMLVSAMVKNIQQDAQIKQLQEAVKPNL